MKGVLAMSAVLLTLLGCASPMPMAGMTDQEVAEAAGEVVQGPWTNIYRDDPNLAGVTVQQLPDGDDGFSLEERNGKHPCMILYAFWNDRYRQMTYTPGGELMDAFWFEVDESNCWVWLGVDFAHGSDPTFDRHQDPRVRWAKPLKRYE